MAELEIVADLGEITREEWLVLRRQGVGGSDAGSVAGLNHFADAYDVWVDKTTTEPVVDDQTEAQLWGTLLEPVIGLEAGRRLGIEVHPFKKMVRNTAYPWAYANVDFLTGSVAELDGVLEIKTTSAKNAGAWAEQEDGSIKVPDSYAIQGQHYLAVLDLPRVYFACLIGGQRLVTTVVERNQELIDTLMKIEEAFWEQVVSRTPPPRTRTK